MRARIVAAALALLVTATFAASTERASGVDAYRALGVPVKDVLAGTVLNARVVAGDGKQVVCVVTYLTGKRDESSAVNVRMGVFEPSGDRLATLYTRDFGAEEGGHVANGDLELLDLDRDGVSEIIVSFDSFLDPLVQQRFAEVILRKDGEFQVAWKGAIEFDATRAARGVPRERRDRYTREFDWANTLRTQGVTLFITKTMTAVAGERLDEPKIVQETFPLKPAPQDW